MTGKSVIIVRVSETATDEAIEDALSEPAARGYYLGFMLEPRDGNLRAVFKRSVTYVDPAEQAAQQAARAAEDAKALEILDAHPHATQVQATALLSASGIVRSRSWVSEQRALKAARSAAESKR